MSEGRRVQPARFGVEGYLEPGFHHWDVDSLGFHFVRQVPESTTRPAIWEGFAELQACFATLGLTVEHWVDGSFTTTKPDPNDIDVANFFDADEIEAIPDEREALFRAYVGGKVTQRICRCDSYFAVKVPEDHPLRDDFETAYNYWLEKFGTDRNDVPKGFVVTRLVPPPPVPPSAEEPHEPDADAT